MSGQNQAQHHSGVARRQECAAERPSKRAKTGKEPSPQLASHMIRLLKHDINARHSVCLSLTVHDLDALLLSCRSWHGWIAHPPKHLLPSFACSAKLGPIQVCSMALSVLARQYVTTLVVPEGEEWEAEYVNIALLALTQYGRLKNISMTLRRELVKVDSLPLFFMALASKLQTATLTLNGAGADRLAADVVSAVGAVGACSRLATLVLQRGEGEEEEEVDPALLQVIDFSSLATVPHLSTFRMALTKEEYTCSPAQVEVLARCKALSTLDFKPPSHNLLKSFVLLSKDAASSSSALEESTSNLETRPKKY